MSEQSGWITTHRLEMTELAHALLNRHPVEHVRVEKYDEWKIDDWWRLEIVARCCMADKTYLRVTYVYERPDHAGTPWGLIAMQSEPA